MVNTCNAFLIPCFASAGVSVNTDKVCLIPGFAYRGVSGDPPQSAPASAWWKATACSRFWVLLVGRCVVTTYKVFCLSGGECDHLQNIPHARFCLSGSEWCTPRECSCFRVMNSYNVFTMPCMVNAYKVF